jgi:dipeptidyl aminopeptidase/acylaminoacyl peptidase
MGERPPMDAEFNKFVREGKYAEASPITHVTPDDAAFLFVHGIQDKWVDVQHARLMHDSVREAGLDTKIVVLDEQAHWPTLDGRLISGWLIEQLGSD